MEPAASRVEKSQPLASSRVAAAAAAEGKDGGAVGLGGLQVDGGMLKNKTIGGRPAR